MNQISTPEEGSASQFSEFLSALVKPISAGEPMGDDPRYIPEFESVKTEIEKTSSMDVEMIQNNCFEILSRKSKDVRVFGFFILAAIKQQEYEKVAEIIQGLTITLVNHFDDIHPKRLNAKVNALSWFNNDKLEIMMTDFKGDVSICSPLKLALEGLLQIKKLLNEKFDGNPPSMGKFIKSIERWTTDSTPKAAPKPPPAPAPIPTAETATSPSPEGATVNNTVPAPQIQSATLNIPQVEDKSGAEVSLQKIADFYQELDETNSMGTKLMRILKWADIRKAPPVQGGVLKIQGPNKQIIAHLQNLYDGQNWADLVKACENAFTRPAHHFWLDLQFYEWTALEGMGPNYVARAEAITSELVPLMQRAPEILFMSYMDGTPFAKSDTQAWIQDLKQKATAGGANTGSESSLSEEEKQEAKSLVSKKKLTEALQFIESGVKGFGLKEISERKLFMAETCFGAGKIKSAEGLVDSLIEQFKGTEVLEWDTHFSFNLYNLAIKTYQKISEAPGLEKEEIQIYRKKISDYSSLLSQISPIKFATLF